MPKRWNILKAPDALAKELQASLKIHPILCAILAQRGICTYEKAKHYFRPQLNDLHDPWLMKDMLKAVKRILLAMERKEKILVFGDYDVDGTTSVACMFSFLCSVYDKNLLDFYIPHRYREGYGISKAGIDFAKQEGFTLIISLDCGIKSVDLIGYAKELAIDFVVCDHHLPDSVLPPAVAILNPKQSDCEYPYKELCGCGVGFKLISALCEEMNLPAERAQQYLDLVATAIAADIVPMTGENRIMAFYGLVKANTTPNVGILALKELSARMNDLVISDLVFMIAPRVNAAGRMDDARKAVMMFIAETQEEAKHYAEQLHSDNKDRKEADKSITDEALQMIQSNPEWQDRKSTVVYQPTWHKGVVGIVASRLIDSYYRPTIVLTQSGEYAAGSARSVPGFNLYEAIHACKDYLLGYGGHYAAAGMTLEATKIDAFREAFEKQVASTIKPEQLIPEIVIDSEITLKDINLNFYNILQQMEPFGPENNKPVFVCRKVTDTGKSALVKGDHLKVQFKQDGFIVGGIGFGMKDFFPLVSSGNPVDVVFTLDENEWNGVKSVQMKVIDVRESREM
ncbi:MAG: single-stranded-DNA-specific exonuclease RecJ [Chitinophagaceae bacterium]|jgi:single-stranded-DNA-specific exonuclease|uniref:single-stranded-DNA-specific exonuclease RecJ n=1 Tax=unclassified Paraflavitalea TaxID=2798305 RepID=UPI003D326201|nr:single-stranded-DNA-specific exonuclease RecJ [Chitinophagaceae bacterium]